MKILDRYILTTYLKTFFSVFIILMLIFVLQTIWLYIKELAGKDLDVIIIMKFLFYFMPKLIPLVLPLTILLSSIMVFGSFAENYEFAAMKSTGISLQRAMKSLSFFIVGLGIITFFFTNNIIPWAEIKSFNLRKNIAKLKPAAFIAEGQFNQLDDGFNIKVDKKSGDTDQYLEKVVIHKHAGLGQHKTIISETGEFFYKENSEVLQLILHNGNYYEDILSNNSRGNNIKPFAKSSFDKYIINIDLSQMNKVDIDETSQTDNYSMLDLPGLSKAMDSLIKNRQTEHKTISNNLLLRFNAIKYNRENSDTLLRKRTIYNGNALDLFDTTKKIHLIDNASKSIASAKQILEFRKDLLKHNKTIFNKHVISYNEKFSLGFACIILFFVGAPLGALIRKGGMGLPMVIAILLFLTYHFIGVFAINSAKNGNFNPTLASWFSTLIMLPLGIYLTRRATADRSIFEIGNIIEPLKKVFNIKKKEDLSYTFLSTYNNEQLVNIIKNYEALKYDKAICFEALNILFKKGESVNSLKKLGITFDSNYEVSQITSTNYKIHSKFASWLYTIAGIILALFFLFKKNNLESLESATMQLSILLFILYAIYYIKTLINILVFYKNLINERKKPNIILLILGLPLYFIVFPFINTKVKEDSKQNCLDSIK